MSAVLQSPPVILGFLGSSILLILCTSLFLAHSKSSHTRYDRINQLTILSILLSLAWALRLYPEKKWVLLSGHFLWDPFTALLSITVMGLSIPVFIYVKDVLVDFPNSGDYYLLCLLSLFGTIVMLTAGSMITFYLGLEITSLPIYGLVALGYPNNLKIEAAVKYVVMSIISSALLLYGFCLLYFLSGNFSLDALSTASTAHSIKLAYIGEGLVLMAVLFKLGVVPFHFWVPDVYEEAPFPTTVFVATVSKFAAIAINARLFRECLSHLACDFQSLLILVGILSIVMGNLVALMQTRIRRLLAYSSIAHMGFVIVGLALPVQGTSTAIFYGIGYCFTVMLLFGVLAYLKKMDIPIETTQNLQGLSARYPMAAFLMLLCLSSMAGIPPLIGFFTKLSVLYHLFKANYYLMGGIALLATVVGSYYYLVMIKLMYFEPPTGSVSLQPKSYSALLPFALGCSGFLFVTFSLYPALCIEKLGESVAQTSVVDKAHSTLSIAPLFH